MNSSRHNLFGSLSRWASSQQENFLTESFARLIEILRDTVPDTFADLISFITNGAVDIAGEQSPEVTISTQVSADDSNYPDLEIKGPDLLIWVEVKDASPMNPDQLARYSKLLEARSVEQKSLVFLSRSTSELPDVPLLAKPLSWTAIAEWLREAEDWDETRAELPVASFVTREFYEFLEEKGMAVEKIGWELIPGVYSLRDLQTMMSETLQTLLSSRIWAAGSHVYTGWGIYGEESSNRTVAYLFVNYGVPEEIRFSVQNELLKEELQHVWEPHDRDSSRRTLDMTSEEVHFLALSSTSQRRVLHDFVESCLDDTTIEQRETGQSKARIESDGTAVD